MRLWRKKRAPDEAPGERPDRGVLGPSLTADVPYDEGAGVPETDPGEARPLHEAAREPDDDQHDKHLRDDDQHDEHLRDEHLRDGPEHGEHEQHERREPDEDDQREDRFSSSPF